ncbi:hypothetical protein [Microbacterium tumbae]
MTTAVPTVLLAVGALAAVVIGVFAARVAPRAAFVAWSGVLFFVPVWVGASAGIFWAAITALTIFLIVVNWSLVPLRVADLWVIGFIVLTVGLYGMGSVTLSAMTIAILEWVVPYIWGRVVLARVGEDWVVVVIAVVATIAGVLTILEFVVGWNPFILIPGTGEAHEVWSTLQYRGGVPRAEGAFGHSIALGASLAMSVAFVVATRWPLVPKILAVAVVSAGAVLTFSRAGIITLVLTLILSTFLLPGVSRVFRVTFAVVALAALAVVMPIVDAVFGTAEDDLAVSGGYRSDLFVLLSQVQLFGSPGDWQSRVVGDQYLGYFARTIDNALLLILLRVGWVPTLLLVAALVCAALAAVRKSTRSPASLAVVGQLPSLVVVALITQYGMYLWFCVGLAIAWSNEGRRPPEPFSSDNDLVTVESGSGHGLRT